MTLSELAPPEQRRRLVREGLALEIGPFVVKICSSVNRVADGIATVYADHSLADDADFADFYVSIDRPRGLRRWLRPQALFRFDGRTPFKPLPLDQALPLLEWGLNWTISSCAHQYLIIHAATVEHDGRVAILPGTAGSGKSTLAAALTYRGWRLFSDELALIEPPSLDFVALARPVSLKNESIDVMRRFAPHAVLTAPVHDTTKGSVALMKPPRDSVVRVRQRGRAAWIITPRYSAGAAARLVRRRRAPALLDLGTNAFNYSIHGEAGFAALAEMVEHCACYDFTYSRLEEAMALFEALAGDRTPAALVDEETMGDG